MNRLSTLKKTLSALQRSNDVAGLSSFLTNFAFKNFMEFIKNKNKYSEKYFEEFDLSKYEKIFESKILELKQENYLSESNGFVNYSDAQKINSFLNEIEKKFKIYLEKLIKQKDKKDTNALANLDDIFQDACYEISNHYKIPYKIEQEAFKVVWEISNFINKSKNDILMNDINCLSVIINNYDAKIDMYSIPEEVHSNNVDNYILLNPPEFSLSLGQLPTELELPNKIHMNLFLINEAIRGIKIKNFGYSSITKTKLVSLPIESHINASVIAYVDRNMMLDFSDILSNSSEIYSALKSTLIHELTHHVQGTFTAELNKKYQKYHDLSSFFDRGQKSEAETSRVLSESNNDVALENIFKDRKNQQYMLEYLGHNSEIESRIKEFKSKIDIDKDTNFGKEFGKMIYGNFGSESFKDVNFTLNVYYLWEKYISKIKQFGFALNKTESFVKKKLFTISVMANKIGTKNGDNNLIDVAERIELLSEKKELSKEEVLSVLNEIKFNDNENSEDVLQSMMIEIIDKIKNLKFNKIYLKKPDMETIIGPQKVFSLDGKVINLPTYLVQP